MGSLSKSFHTVSFGDEPICCVAFSPHEWSQNFIAAATRNKLIIASVQLLDEQLDFNVIREFHHPSPITHLAWSPLSSDSMPKLCRIATAGSDSKIRIYNSNLAQSEDVMELCGHTDTINSVAFHPDPEENFLVSCSDDFTCKIWSTSDGTLLKTIPLNSPGMAIRFNAMESSKFLVLEKSGLVWIVSMTADLTPITSLSNSYCHQDPCLDADWSATDPSRVVTALGGRILYWNLSRASLPEEMLSVAGEMVHKVRFHPTLDNYVAVLGSPGPVVSVMQSTGPTLVTDPLMAATDLSWHRYLPLLAVANDRAIKFWKLLLK